MEVILFSLQQSNGYDSKAFICLSDAHDVFLLRTFPPKQIIYKFHSKHFRPSFVILSAESVLLFYWFEFEYIQINNTLNKQYIGAAKQIRIFHVNVYEYVWRLSVKERQNTYNMHDFQRRSRKTKQQEEAKLINISSCNQTKLMVVVILLLFLCSTTIVIWFDQQNEISPEWQQFCSCDGGWSFLLMSWRFCWNSLN